MDDYFAQVVDMWKQQGDELLDDLKARYGPTFTDDVYRDILEVAEDAANLLAVIEDKLGLPIERLADLKTQPPEYLFVTKRFTVRERTRDTKTLNLWNHLFDL